MNGKYLNIMYYICYRNHKSRDVALDLLVNIEMDIRIKEDLNQTYYYLALGKLDYYFKQYNISNNK